MSSTLGGLCRRTDALDHNNHRPAFRLRLSGGRVWLPQEAWFRSMLGPDPFSLSPPRAVLQPTVVDLQVHSAKEKNATGVQEWASVRIQGPTP